MAGRKTKLAPERQDKIVQAIRAGNYANVAAAYAGIGESTFYEWIQRGEKAQSGLYSEFAEAVKRAEAEAEVHAVAIIRRAMPENWTAAMAYLERRNPNRWGRRVKEHKIEVTGTIPISIINADVNKLK